MTIAPISEQLCVYFAVFFHLDMKLQNFSEQF